MKSVPSVQRVMLAELCVGPPGSQITVDPTHVKHNVSKEFLPQMSFFSNERKRINAPKLLYYVYLSELGRSIIKNSHPDTRKVRK